MHTRVVANTLRQIVTLLARRDLVTLHRLDVNKHWQITELAASLDEFAGAVTLPIDDQWNYYFYPIDGTDELAIDYNLLLDNELSDFTLQCRLMDDDEGEVYSFSIESIHIL